MEKKTTKKEMWTAILADLEKTNVADKARKIETIEHEIELLSKKRTSTSGKTATAELNEKLAEKLFNQMKDNQYYRASETMQMIEEINSTSKATAVLNVLCNLGKAERIKEKGNTYFIKRV